ncbi:hypothetical protein FS749_000915 [Ceratobasidium sp. UAMH 11750]|nr:hypothetical protein FS749_000915 [Ceratobasidium sp. UAMH 11750]
MRCLVPKYSKAYELKLSAANSSARLPANAKTFSDIPYTNWVRPIPAVCCPAPVSLGCQLASRPRKTPPQNRTRSLIPRQQRYYAVPIFTLCYLYQADWCVFHAPLITSSALYPLKPGLLIDAAQLTLDDGNQYKISLAADLDAGAVGTEIAP